MLSGEWPALPVQEKVISPCWWWSEESLKTVSHIYTSRSYPRGTIPPNISVTMCMPKHIKFRVVKAPWFSMSSLFWSFRRKDWEGSTQRVSDQTNLQEADSFLLSTPFNRSVVGSHYVWCSSGGTQTLWLREALTPSNTQRLCLEHLINKHLPPVLWGNLR